MTTGNCLCWCKNWACQIVFGWPYSNYRFRKPINLWLTAQLMTGTTCAFHLPIFSSCLFVCYNSAVIGSTLQMFTDELQTNCIHELFCSYNRYSSDPNSINFYICALVWNLYIFINMEKYKYRKVASSIPVYYSIFNNFGDATNWDVLLTETCYYSLL